jgi:Tfp pilus assembly protein PilF
MGNVFQEEKNYLAAANAYERAVQIDPAYARSYFCIANLYRELKQQTQALEHYNKAIELDPKCADFYNNRGLLNYEINEVLGSEADFHKAIQLNPHDAYFYNNLGVLYQCLNKHQQAHDLFLKAISIEPNYISSYLNIGINASVLGDQQSALRYYEQAIEIDPNYPDAQNTKCIALLLTGQYEAGWQLHEWRWKTHYKPFAHGLPEGQLWNGRDSLAGKTILIESEQGFGDTIQFCRYLPLLEKLGAHVTFRTEKPLISLMQSLPAKMKIIGIDDAFTPTDYYFPLLSLPLAFNTTLETIPNSLPYLFSDKSKSAHWKSRIKQISNPSLRVGLVWAGAARPQELRYRGLNSRRDIALKLLEPLLKENVQFFSLQMGAAATQELHSLDPHLREKIIDWTDELSDFSDTAALIDNLDIVISVDTSTTHLAAALGKPVFLLNRKDTCWRWLEHGGTSPWYPNLTLFRQSELLRWDDVIENVISALRKFPKPKTAS